jgi:hypothetical protein
LVPYFLPFTYVEGLDSGILKIDLFGGEEADIISEPKKKLFPKTEADKHFFEYLLKNTKSATEATDAIENFKNTPEYKLQKESFYIRLANSDPASFAKKTYAWGKKVMSILDQKTKVISSHSIKHFLDLGSSPGGMTQFIFEQFGVFCSKHVSTDLYLRRINLSVHILGLFLLIEEESPYFSQM